MTTPHTRSREVAHQGRCTTCRHAFRFTLPRRLEDAYCPRCKTVPLVRASYSYNYGPWHDRANLDGPDIAPTNYRLVNTT